MLYIEGFAHVGLQQVSVDWCRKKIHAHTRWFIVFGVLYV